MVELRNGYTFGFPPERVPGLGGATREQLSEATISPSGDGLLWDNLNAHASLTGIVAEAFNLEQWAPRLLGQRTSEAKAAAARENGKKGGRPRRAAHGTLAGRAVSKGFTKEGVARADALAAVEEAAAATASAVERLREWTGEGVEAER